MMNEALTLQYLSSLGEMAETGLGTLGFAAERPADYVSRITPQSEPLYAAPLHRGLDQCHWIGHLPRRGL